MLHPEGIEVFIKSLDRNEFYQEYKKSREVDNRTAMERYIQVEVGERFAIIVRTTPAFKFHSAPGIKIQRTIDDGAVRGTHYRTARQMQNNDYEDLKASQNIEGKLMRAGFFFGSLELDEDRWEDDAEALRFAEKNARITVHVARGQWMVRNGSRVHGMRSQPTISASKQVTKKLGITNCLKPLLDGTEIETTHAKTSYDFVPLAGVHGKTLTFTFRYRSKMTLNRLDILPFSPLLAAQDNQTPVPIVEPLFSLRAPIHSEDVSVQSLRPVKRNSSQDPGVDSTSIVPKKKQKTNSQHQVARGEHAGPSAMIATEEQQMAPLTTFRMTDSVKRPSPRCNIVDLTSPDNENETGNRYQQANALIKAEPSGLIDLTGEEDQIRLLDIEKRRIELVIARRARQAAPRIKGEVAERG